MSLKSSISASSPLPPLPFLISFECAPEELYTGKSRNSDVNFYMKFHRPHLSFFPTLVTEGEFSRAKLTSSDFGYHSTFPGFMNKAKNSADGIMEILKVK